MNTKYREKFVKILSEKRKKILRKAIQTLETEMALDVADLPDEMDLASSEYQKSFQFRLRSREQKFLSKIDKALDRISEGTFGTCEDCEAAINPKRLEARPETTLCIQCKEEQEREERQLS